MEPGPVKGGIRDLVVEVWSEILGVKATAEDDFFALGGDSISSIQVVTRLSEMIGVEIPPTTLYTHTTVVDWSNEIERLRAEPAA